MLQSVVCPEYWNELMTVALSAADLRIENDAAKSYKLGPSKRCGVVYKHQS